MLGVAIELRTQCARCGQGLPINACAPRFVCAACGHVNAIDDDRWRSLLEDLIPELDDLAEGEGKTRTIMTGAATYAMTYGRQAPRCSACKTTMPVEAYAFVERGFTICVGCGARMTLRRPPPVVASLGIAYLVAEEAAQLGGAPGKAPAAPQPIVLYCANCKAPLSVDGSSRIVRCQYCSTDVYLPDDLWQRLHPVATVARWYLCTSAEHVAARRVQTWQWGSLEDVVMDPAGNLYCVGAHEDAFDDASVWCLAPDLSLRWFVDLKDFAYSDAHLALDPGGRLLVWREHKHSALVLSAQNGATLGKLGGKQPDGATAHTFDLDHAKWLRFDADGSILALLGERLVRFSGDGGPLPTWPPKKGMFGAKAEKLRPIYGPGHQLIDVDGVYIEHVGSQPTELDDYTHLHVGWDGRLYAERSEWVACFDRSGERVYRTKLPVDDMKGDYLGTDAAGNLYVPATLAGDPRPRVIVRVSPDGKRVDTIATDHRQGGVVGDEDRMVVRSDGIIVLLGYGMRWRVIGPDGGLRAQSDKSRQEDASELARDAAED